MDKTDKLPLPKIINPGDLEHQLERFNQFLTSFSLIQIKQKEPFFGGRGEGGGGRTIVFVCQIMHSSEIKLNATSRN